MKIEDILKNFSFLNNKKSDSKTSKPLEYLEKFCLNLNKEVIEGNIDPVVGRYDEIKRLISILLRKNKNNVLLLGEPGVGKTAIVEGLVQKIIKKEVPGELQNAIVFTLNVVNLMSNTKFQGEFEERVKKILKIITESKIPIILFIDEVHLIVGLGKNQGTNDFANILKPLLTKNKLRCIGATTFWEYKKYLELDTALTRRFHNIIVKEPSEDETLYILRSLKKKWEQFHKLSISDEAIEAAVRLSKQYISNKFLPDKAIDLIDESCAQLKTNIFYEPKELEEVNKELLKLDNENFKLIKKYSPEELKNNIYFNNFLLPMLKKKKLEKLKILNKWNKQKILMNNLKKLQNELTHTLTKKKKAENKNNLILLSEIKFQKLPELEKKFNKIEHEIKKLKFFKKELKAVDVEKVIFDLTGIPINKTLLLGKTKDTLNKTELFDKLKEDIVGQDEALMLLNNALLRNRTEILDPNRPIANLMFLGSTGVGKTSLCKALAKNIFNDEKKLIKIDMSEFMEAHSISKLIGSPPGYIGFEEKGYLTEQIKFNPYSVVLFDEIEKAHPDILNLLLQLLDEGSLKDSLGKVYDFKNAIIILTSNLGADIILNNKINKDKELVLSKLKKLLKSKFKSEFLNRIDEIVVFNTLGVEEVEIILNKELKKLSERIYKLKNIKLFFDNEVKMKILEESYSVAFGARNINRYLQKNIETFIAQEIVENKLLFGKSYLLSLNENNNFTISDTLKLN